jgi:hypothetical protein
LAFKKKDGEKTMSENRIYKHVSSIKTSDGRTLQFARGNDGKLFAYDTANVGYANYATVHEGTARKLRKKFLQAEAQQPSGVEGQSLNPTPTTAVDTDSTATQDYSASVETPLEDERGQYTRLPPNSLIGTVSVYESEEVVDNPPANTEAFEM